MHMATLSSHRLYLAGIEAIGRCSHFNTDRVCTETRGGDGVLRDPCNIICDCGDSTLLGQGKANMYVMAFVGYTGYPTL